MLSEETLFGRKKNQTNNLVTVGLFTKNSNFSFSAKTHIVTVLIIPKLNYRVSCGRKQHDIYHTFLNPGMPFNCFVNIVKVQHAQKKFKF